MEGIKIFAFADEADKQIDGQIVTMKKNGLNGLEIRNVDGTNVSKISLEKAREVKQKLDDAGLVTWSVGSPIGKIKFGEEDFEAHLEVFKHTLQIAKILGAENIRMFSFFISKDEDPENYKEEVFARLNRLVEIAKDSGIDLCHENEKGIYGDIAKRCLEIHKAVPGLKAVFDPANFVQCGQDTLEAWEMLKPYVKYVHIKDARADGNIVPAGEGIGNVREIARKYIQNGGTVFTMEPHLMEFDGLQALEAEGDKSVVGQLRTFASHEEAFDVACDAFKALLK